MASKTDLPAVPSQFADVALVDAPTFAAAAGMGLTKLHDLVGKGLAPQPVIRRPRFTRWQAGQVRAWLIEQAATSGTAFATAVAEPLDLTSMPTGSTEPDGTTARSRAVLRKAKQ